MTFIRELFTIILIIITSPILIPYSILTVRKKRWFFTTLIKPLEETIKNDTIETLMSIKTKEIERNLESILLDLDSQTQSFYLSVDWKDIDEVEVQGDILAQTHGITNKFLISNKDDEDSVWLRLIIYDNWLAENGYSFVLWNKESDQYSGFICPSTSADKFIKVGNSLGLQLLYLDHNYEQ